MAEEIHTQYSLCLFHFQQKFDVIVGRCNFRRHLITNSICDICESNIAVTNVALQIGFIRLLVVGFREVS